MNEWSQDIDLTPDEMKAVPEKVKRRVHMIESITRELISLIKLSSIRYELGLMTREEANHIKDFAYIPVRNHMADTTWQNNNPEILQPKIWTFGGYYTALVILSKGIVEN